ncbi:PorV/PorQ family protein [Elusimicrobiota bacterium]
MTKKTSRTNKQAKGMIANFKSVLILATLISLGSSSNLINAAGETSAESLLLGVGARPAALGDAYTAVSNDAFSLAYNPAGIATMPSPELAFMHNEWLLGSSQEFIGLGYPLKRGSLGLQITQTSLGTFTGRNALGQTEADFTGGSMSASLGYALPLYRGFSMGGAVRHYSETLAGYKASTMMFDLGLMMKSGSLSFGASLLNMGNGLRFIEEVSPLPQTLALGLSKNFDMISVTVDAKKRIQENKVEFSMGTEYFLLQGFDLRLGYAMASAANNNALAGLGTGFGMQIGKLGMDYAFKPFGGLGNAHKFSFNIKF